MSALWYIFSSLRFGGSSLLSASISFAGIGAFAAFLGGGTLGVNPIIQYWANNPATWSGAGHLCVNGVVRLGSPLGATSNTVIMGPGPTNNVVV